MSRRFTPEQSDQIRRLARLEGKNYREIGEILDAPAGTVEKAALRLHTYKDDPIADWEKDLPPLEAGRRVDQAQASRIRQLHHQGISYKAIADDLGLSGNLPIRVVRRAGPYAQDPIEPFEWHTVTYQGKTARCFKAQLPDETTTLRTMWLTEDRQILCQVGAEDSQSQT